MSFHSEQTAIHRIHSFEYADAAARLAATGFDDVDIGKVSHQLDNNTFHILTTTIPTWVEITIASGNVFTTDISLVAGQLLIGDGGFDILTESQLLWSGTGLGIGKTPAGRLHIHEDTAFGGPSGGVTIEQEGSGDAMLHWLRTGGTPWIMGIDGGQSDAFKIQPNNTFNSVVGLTILTGGNVGLGILPGTEKLHLAGSTGDTVPFVKYSQLGVSGVTISDFFGSRLPDGLITALAPGDFYRRSSGVGSGVFIFKGAAPGDTGWEEVHTGTGGNSVTTSDVLTNNRLLTGNGGVDVVVEPTMSFSGGFFLIEDDVAASTAFSLANNDTDVTFSVDGAIFQQRHINQDGVAIMDFLAQPEDGTSAAEYRFGRNSLSVGHNRLLFFDPDGVIVQTQLASSGIDSFINAQGGLLGLGLTVPLATFDILSALADTAPILKLASAITNPGAMTMRVGNRDPNGVVTGIGPDAYFADRGALSGSYESLSAAADQIWLRRSVLPANIKELHNSAQLDDLASGGIITITENTTWRVRGPLTTANRIVINAGVILHITGEYNSTSSIAYSGTLTFVSGAGALRTWAQISIIFTSTGTFLDIDGGLGINLTESSIIGCDDLGEIANTGFLTSDSRYLNIGSGLTLTNTFLVNASLVLLIGSPLNGPLFTINLNSPDAALSFVDIQGIALGSAGSLFDLDARINNSADIKINQCSTPNGSLFRQSVLTDATIDSIVDGSPATGTITGMADNLANGTTIFSTTTYLEDELVTITGTISYNGEFRIFNVVAGVSFDTITVFNGNDAAGSVDSERLTLSLATGHGISIGDSLKIFDTNFYNGFVIALGVVSDDITVNGDFIRTDTGSIKRDLSLDQSDPRVDAMNNKTFLSSHSIAGAFVNDNAVASPIPMNSTFNDMVFGTVGDALLAISTMEGWRLVDEITGEFEYIDLEPFDGKMSFDYTVGSTGAAQPFRFRWQIDKGAGFVDLDDPVEASATVGGSVDASVTKGFPLKALTGNRIKPQLTRDNGSSDIIARYASIYVEM